MLGQSPLGPAGRGYVYQLQRTLSQALSRIRAVGRHLSRQPSYRLGCWQGERAYYVP